MTDALFFLIAWACLPILWKKMLLIARVDLKKITIPSILFVAIILLQYLGLPFLYFGLDQYRIADISNPALITEVFFLTAVTTTLLLTGYILARLLFRTNFATSGLNRFYAHVTVPTRREVRVGIVYLLVGLLALYFYIGKVGFSNTALASAAGLAQSLDMEAVLRSKMGNAFEGRYYLYKLFMRDVLTLGSFVMFIALLLRRTRIRLAIFVASFVACAASLLLAAEKGPFAQYVVGLLFCFLLVRRNGRYSMRLLFFGSIVLAFIISASYMLFMGAATPFEGLAQGVSRVFTGQIQPLYHYLEVFPDRVPHLHGRSFPNPMEIFPFEHYNLTVEVMDIVQPWNRDLGVIGTMPTFFWGELYANFGYFGVFVAPVFVGAVVCFIADFLDKFRPSPIVVATMVWFAFHIKNLSTTSLSNYLLDFYGTFVFFLLIASLFYIGAVHRKVQPMRLREIVTTRA